MLKNKILFVLLFILLGCSHQQKTTRLTTHKHGSNDVKIKKHISQYFYHHINGKDIPFARYDKISDTLIHSHHNALNQIMQNIKKEQNLTKEQEKFIDFINKITLPNQDLTEQILTEQKKINALNTIEDLYQYFTYSQRIGLNIPFHVQHVKDKKQHYLYIAPSTSLNHYQQNIKHNTHQSDVFTQYIFDFIIRHQLAMPYKTEKSFKQIHEINNIVSKKGNKKVKADKLTALFPAFHWDLLLSHFKKHINDIVIQSPNQIQSLLDNVKDFSIQDWKIYINLKLIHHYMTLLSHDEEKFYTQLIAKTTQPNHTLALKNHLIELQFHDLLAEYTETRPVYQESKVALQTTFQFIKKAYIQWLKKNNSKKRHINKIDEMPLHIENMFDGGYQIKYDYNAIQNVNNIYRAYYDNDNMIVKNSTINLNSPQSFYQDSTLHIPKTLLYSNLYNIDLGESYNYANLGVIIVKKIFYYLQKEKSLLYKNENRFKQKHPLKNYGIKEKIEQDYIDMIAIQIALNAYKMQYQGSINQEALSAFLTYSGQQWIAKNKKEDISPIRLQWIMENITDFNKIYQKTPSQ